jgi:hypothetical protein
LLACRNRDKSQQHAIFDVHAAQKLTIGMSSSEIGSDSAIKR